jgi:hypothetical protein
LKPSEHLYGLEVWRQASPHDPCLTPPPPCRSAHTARTPCPRSTPSTHLRPTCASSRVSVRARRVRTARTDARPAGLQGVRGPLRRARRAHALHRPDPAEAGRVPAPPVQPRPGREKGVGGRGWRGRFARGGGDPEEVEAGEQCRGSVSWERAKQRCRFVDISSSNLG